MNGVLKIILLIYTLVFYMYRTFPFLLHNLYFEYFSFFYRYKCVCWQEAFRRIWITDWICFGSRWSSQKSYFIPKKIKFQLLAICILLFILYQAQYTFLILLLVSKIIFCTCIFYIINKWFLKPILCFWSNYTKDFMEKN